MGKMDIAFYQVQDAFFLRYNSITYERVQAFDHGQVAAVYLYHSTVAGVLDVVVKEELNYGASTYCHDSAARKRMAQEAELNERVHGYGLFLQAETQQEPDRILLRYLPYPNVSLYLSRHRAQPSAMIKIFAMMARALEMFYIKTKQKYFHGDFHNRNVLVHGNRCFLIDFGESIVRDQDLRRYSASIKETSSHLPPEFFNDSKQGGDGKAGAADLYSLGYMIDYYLPAFDDSDPVKPYLSNLSRALCAENPRDRMRLCDVIAVLECLHDYVLSGNNSDRLTHQFFERAGVYRQLKMLLFEACKRDDPLDLLDHENEFRRDKMQTLMRRKVNIMADLKSYFFEVFVILTVPCRVKKSRFFDDYQLRYPVYFDGNFEVSTQFAPWLKEAKRGFFELSTFDALMQLHQASEKASTLPRLT